jgi:hypothetical protein
MNNKLFNYMKKERLKRIFFIIISISFIIIITEISSRIIAKIIGLDELMTVAGVYHGKRMAEYSLDTNGSPIWRNGYQTYVGIRLKPQFVYYNKDGFREPDQRNFNKNGIKIGIFGDSYTENLQVPEYRTYAVLLQEKLNRQFHGEDFFVFNFAYGGYATYQEYKRYLTVKEKVKLDYVVLAFLPQNDVLGNHCILGKPYELPRSSYMKIIEGKFEETKRKNDDENIAVAPFINSLQWAKRHFYFLGLLSQLKIKIKAAFLANEKINIKQIPKAGEDPYVIYRKGGERYAWMGVFNQPLNKDWDDAWKITEECILRMKGIAEKEGSVFILLILTDGLQINHRSDLDSQYDFRYPNRRLSRFAELNNIRYLDTYDSFMNKKKDLSYPYFSWEYDGHYSEKGTEFVSGLLLEYFSGILKSHE